MHTKQLYALSLFYFLVKDNHYALIIVKISQIQPRNKNEYM
jgi:hypothetical protein